MKIKQILALLLAFVLVLGGIPAAGMPALLTTAKAAGTIGYEEDGKAKTLKITGPEGWAYFAAECFPNRKGMPGWTVTLENDIELPAGLIPSVDDFKGTFEGNGHFIKIDNTKNNGNSYFSTGSDSLKLGVDVGLFRNLLETGTVQNLILWLQGGTLQATTIAHETITAYGALVGRMTETAKLQNCALVGNGTVVQERFVDRTMRYNGTTCVGSMVGQMDGTTKIDGCYSELSVKNEMTVEMDPLNPINTTAINFTGGIVGMAMSSSCTISNTAYMGPQIDMANTQSGISYNYGGGIVGVNATVSNCFVKGTSLTCYRKYNGATSMISGYFGYIGTNLTKIKAGTCYSNMKLNYYEQSSSENKEGYYANINGVSAEMMGTAWANTLAGFPSLKWLVTQAPAVSINVGSAAAISMAPTYAEYSGDKVYDAKKDSLWKFDMSIPLKGRTAPLTDDVMLHKTGSGSAIVTKVEVSDNSNVGGTYFSGLDYPFLATIIGKDVEGNLSTEKLTWTASGKHSSGVGVDASSWWGEKGKLSIPADFYGTIDVTATYDGVVSLPGKELTVKRGVLALENQTVQPGTMVPMKLNLSASEEVLKKIELPNVTWTLAGASTSDLNLDSNGFLVVGPSAKGTAKVTASVAGMLDATATITIGKPTEVLDSNAKVLSKTTKTSPTQTAPIGIQAKNDSSGSSALSSYSITLPTLSREVAYYYKLVSTEEEASSELAKTYTSTRMLIEGSNPYQIYTVGIKLALTNAGTDFLQKHLLVVAVNSNVGNLLPSSVTRFDLPARPPSAEQTLTCTNKAIAKGAVAPAIGKLTSYYSNTMDEKGNPLSQPLSWAEVLAKIATSGVPLPPLSTEYIATGEITITTYPMKDRFGNIIGKDSRFAGSSAGGGTKGDVAPKPTIHPRESGIITGGVTISVPDGATVLYTATENVITPVIPKVDLKTGQPEKGSTTKTYVVGQEIKFPDAASSFVVCAVAWMPEKSLSDNDYVLYKNSTNLLTPDAPALLVNGVKYNADNTYPENGTIVFEQPELSNGEVLFTVNGEEPVAGRYNTKLFLASGGDGINSFDPSKPYKMTSTSEFISIRAKFHDKKKVLDSPIADYLISIKQKLSAPVASVKTDTMIRPGTSLELSLSDTAIAQLNANSKVAVERLTYQANLDDPKNFPADAKIVVDGDVPRVGTEYVCYSVDGNSQAYTLPVIRYLFGEDKTNLVSEGILYRYGQRRVLSTSKTTTDANGVSTVTTTITITYTNPQPILLSGAAGQQLKLNTLAISGLEARSDSDIVNFRYTIRGAVAKPMAFPETEPNKPTAISIGERIALSSETPDALIFYTLDGSEPKATYTPPTMSNPQGTWAPQEKTLLYNETDAIKMTNNAQLLFTVRAMAVSKDFSLENSVPTLFRYQPPAPVQAVFSLPVQGAVLANQTVKLQCATQDAKIFYKTFPSQPDITTEAGKIANLPKPNKDQIFDESLPIVITRPTWIVAIAEKNGAMSDPTVNAYTVAPQLSEPFASLKTGSVVYKGTRIRLNASGNIAFTMDGSDPKTALAAQSAPVPDKTTEKDAKKAEVLYGNSVVIDADYGKSVTVRAFAYEEGRSPSNTVSFTYTVCEKDTYLVAAPESEAVVTSGDDITLTTGISGGMIFYSIGSKTPTIINHLEDDNNGWGWEDEDWEGDYTHYQWRSSGGTRKGNSVKVTGEPGSTFTVKATAVANGSEGGTVSVFTYRIRGRTPAPTASIPSGAVAFEGATVALTAQEGDIFYTTDGTEPSTSSRIYLEPIKVTGSMVLKAIAVAKDKVESNKVEYLYSYADQTFAPSMSVTSGEIEQGSSIALSTQTEGATIYYTTNGVEPTKDSMLYSSPITIMRPVTIKAIAIRKDLHNSAVNSASYTVVEPELPALDETDGAGKPQNLLDSLVSRRTYFDANAGPKFTGVIMNDPKTNTVLSAEEGSVSKRAQLVVKKINSSDSDQKAVQSALGYHIVSLYDVSLEQDGEQVQPTGEVEIGIPIPKDYQNGIVTVCRVGADNTVEEYEPRRSGSNAYITVQGKLDRYAVVVPEADKKQAKKFLGWQIPVAAVTVFVGTAVMTTLTLVAWEKRRRKANENACEDSQNHVDD